MSINVLFGKLFFLAFLTMLLGCSITESAQQDAYIIEMVKQIDSQNQDDLNIDKFRDSVKSIGITTIPILLESYKYTVNYHTYYIVSNIIADIADMSTVTTVKEFYWSHEESNAKVISIFTLMEIYNRMRSDKTLIVDKEILPVLIDAVKYTEITFGKDGRAHVNNLSMLSAGILEMYAGDVLSDILHPDNRVPVNIQEQQKYLQIWYESNSERVVWDDNKKQFIIK